MRVGLRRSAWYARISDGRAPQPLKLGSQVAVWPESVISQYQRDIISYGGERVGQYRVREHGERANAHARGARA